MPAKPSWWSEAMPELVSKRDLMPSVEKLQTMFVRYKCQPEAQVTQGGWDLSASQRFAEQLAAEEQQAYLREESLLYNGLAPTSIALRVVEAPAEFAVPVKQDRRLTPNFKVRVEVGFKNRCSFPLTLKVYVISQQEKDSVPEWVPDDFLDPDLPQRKPITELKGTTVITHHFEGTAELDAEQLAQQQQQKQQQQQLAAQAAQALLSGGTGDGNMAWATDVDPQLLESVLQDSARGGGLDPSTAAALTAAMQLNGGTNPLDALTNVLGASAANLEAEGTMSHDYEFSSVELVKPTRMNKVYLVFACSILEQDLMFVVYNVPTVGICRAEQRAKACQKLGVSYTELGGLDFNTDGQQQQQQAAAFATPSLPAGPLGRTLSQQAGANAAAAAAAVAGMSMSAYNTAVAQQQQQQQSHKRLLSQTGWGNDGLMMPDGLMGAADISAAALAAAGGDLSALSLPGMQVDGAVMNALAGGDVATMGLLGPMSLMQQAAMLPGGDAGAVAVGSGGAALPVPPRSRQALQQQLVREYEGAGLTRRLTALDLQALQFQAGFPIDGNNQQEVTMGTQQWGEFMGQFRERLKLLRLLTNVWNQEDPCIIAGFDMEPMGAAAALDSQPVGTLVCCFSLDQPGCLVLVCKLRNPDLASGDDGLLQAVLKTSDLMERRLETWLRDLQPATHVLDVYRNKRLDKRVLLGSNKFTRLRAMDMLDAYDDILI